jgi:hypothetical protein
MNVKVCFDYSTTIRKRPLGRHFLHSLVVKMAQNTNTNLVKDTNEAILTFQFNFKQQHI